MAFPPYQAALGDCGLAAGLAFVSGLCAGQTKSDQDLMSLNIEDLARLKVYTASRHSDDIREAPSSVSVISSEEIRRYGWRTLADLLRSLPGFRRLQATYAVKQLFRKTVEVLRNFGHPHRVVQSFAHQGQHVVEVIWKILFGPVLLPAFGQTEEQRHNKNYFVFQSSA